MDWKKDLQENSSIKISLIRVPERARMCYSTNSLKRKKKFTIFPFLILNSFSIFECQNKYLIFWYYSILFSLDLNIHWKPTKNRGMIMVCTRRKFIFSTNVFSLRIMNLLNFLLLKNLKLFNSKFFSILFKTNIIQMLICCVFRIFLQPAAKGIPLTKNQKQQKNIQNKKKKIEYFCFECIIKFFSFLKDYIVLLTGRTSWTQFSNYCLFYHK